MKIAGPVPTEIRPLQKQFKIVVADNHNYATLYTSEWLNDAMMKK